MVDSARVRGCGRRYPPATKTGPSIAIVGLAAVLLLTNSVRGDWPAARGNGGRTGASTNGPTRRLSPAWSIRLPTPSPAWPGEARGSLWQKLTNSLTARAADDLAPVPIIAAGLVVFGTTHDEVRAVELATGRTVWRYFAGGPVRFAPVAAGGRVFFGSDDGRIHALDLRTGESQWSVRIGPDRPLIAGNGRLISPCPVRTGVLVSDGVVYAAAGLFPVEGTYLVALAASDGALKWRRNLGNDSPQGYLADAGGEIVVPFGRASPKRYRKANGEFVRAVPSASGTLAVVADGETLSGPGATGAIEAADARTGAKIVSFPGRQLAVTPRRTYLVNGLELVALDRVRWREKREASEQAVLWKTECSGGAALMVAGSMVYCGTSTGVEVFDAETGKPRQTLELGGGAVAMAADSNGIVVSARDGAIHAFLESPAVSAAVGVPTNALPASAPLNVRVGAWIAELPVPRGLALVAVDDERWPLVSAVLATSELQVAVVVPDHEVAAARRLLAEAGVLGTRTSVIGRAGHGTVPVDDRLFNLVIARKSDRREALRWACPGPSGLVVLDGRAERVEPDVTAGTWTHQYGSAANECASTQPLTGYPRLRWFGGHGPERMPDRHTRGHAPLAAGGVQLSMAENGLIATDARNGTVRWQLELPESMRYVMPYDAGYAALTPDGREAWVAVDAELWRIDAQSGRVRARHRVPESGRHWGWVAIESGAVYASVLLPTAPRTEKTFELVDLEYRSERPLVTSKALCRVEPDSGKPLWTAATEGAWVNATLCVSKGLVFAVESRGAAARSDVVGRLTCRQILEEARVVCRRGDTGAVVWEKPFAWPAARDVLGLSVQGDRVFFSAAESVGEQAAYHVRCWSVADGRELWEGHALNPVKDLYHGQQVKRPVLMGAVVAFESGLFEAATGARWIPKGREPDWILSRPGHACGGMTGGDGGLLFRADNPTYFRLADGSFTRLSPTRPGCWLNILPAEGGVLIPEASASCICGYPLQTSLGFSFGPEAVPVLRDVIPQ